MTVETLIKELSLIQDKTLEIRVDCTGGVTSVETLPVKGVEILAQEKDLPALVLLEIG
jgi:hypothetical protein